MPIPSILPKGCASTRGVSDIPRMSATGGHVGQLANRLYMLHARQESLINKKKAMIARLKEVMSQLTGITADLRGTQARYRTLSKRNGKGRRGPGQAASGEGPTRGISIEF